MFHHRFDAFPSFKILFHWFILCFIAGYINASGFLATGRFVSHLTGFATLFGVDIGYGDYAAAFGLITVPLFFLMGAFAAGLFIDWRIYRSKSPHYDYVMLIAGICLLLVTVFSNNKNYWSSLNEWQQNYILLILLCLSCGLQNGAISSASSSSVRSTHLTGITTDLGLGLARLMTFDYNNEKQRKEIFIALRRLGCVLSFVFGGLIGAVFYIKFNHKAFLLPAFLCFYIAAVEHKLK